MGLPQVTERGALFAEYRQGMLEGLLDVLVAKGNEDLFRADLIVQDFAYRVTRE